MIWKLFHFSFCVSSSQYTIIFFENKQKVLLKEIFCKNKRKFHTVKCLSLNLSMKDIKKNHSFILKLCEYEFFCVNYGYEKRYKKIMVKVME